MTNPVRLPPLLAVLTWVALITVMIFVAGVAIGIPSYADVLFGFLPDFALPRTPLIALELGFGSCIEAMLVSTGVLVGFVVTDRIFRRSALRWVDALVFAAAAATAMVFVALFFIPGPPQLFVSVLGSVAVGAAIVLVLLVLRHLLRRAAAIYAGREPDVTSGP